MNEHAQQKTGLDKDLKKLARFERGAQKSGQTFAKIGLGVLFLAGVWLVTSMQAGGGAHASFVVIAAVIGGYMAINIGANDVANNVGPAVGSKALTLTGAILIAAIFEAGGAIVAGGDVVSTIKGGIINPALMPDTQTFMTAMMAALLAAALWLNLATYLGAPVSTTHSIVGGVMGAGIAATGMHAVNWATMGKIAASWVISPVMGGVIAALFLYMLRTLVMEREDKISAAKRWVPIVVGIMAAAFSMYLMKKGVKKIYKADWLQIAMIGTAMFALTWAGVKARISQRAATMENRKKSVHQLFVIPLIFSAALLSFAHGANDVANAVGPLAAIVSAASSGAIVTKAGIPLWVMLVGALGISIGLMLYGPRLIRTVGQEITKLNPVRAFCVALSAAITVIIASALGLPVSSTHIAVGGVFGVGFLREYMERRRSAMSFETAIETSTTQGLRTVEEMTPQLNTPDLDSEAEAKKIARKNRKRILVRRQHAWTIAAAWVITVPMAAALSATIFFVLNGVDFG